jgi:hypothetical protein
MWYPPLVGFTWTIGFFDGEPAIAAIAGPDPRASAEATGTWSGAPGGNVLLHDVTSTPNTKPKIAPSAMLESLRVSGTKEIAPDDETKVAIHDADKTRVMAVAKLCIDAQGTVATTKLVKSSGFADYDAKLTLEMAAWKFRPFKADGKPISVCSALTFIYAAK